jgi:hypothetical protein
VGFYTCEQGDRQDEKAAIFATNAAKGYQRIAWATSFGIELQKIVSFLFFFRFFVSFFLV